MLDQIVGDLERSFGNNRRYDDPRGSSSILIEQTFQKEKINLQLYIEYNF